MGPSTTGSGMPSYLLSQVDGISSRGMRREFLRTTGVGNHAATGLDTGVGGVRFPDHEQTWDGQRREDVVESHGLFPLEALGDQSLGGIGHEGLPHGW